MYSVYSILLAWVQGRFYEYIESIKDFKTVRSIVLFNNYTVIGGIQFWFLPVLLECYIFMIIINKYNLYRYLYRLLPGLILIYLIYMYLVDEFLVQIDYMIGSFFLFNGVPMFSFGNYIAYKKQNKEELLNSKWLLFFFVLVEIIYFTTNILNKGVFISRYISILGMLAIFAYASINTEKSINSLIETIGRRYSMYVYLLHVLVYYIAKVISNHFGYMDALIMRYIYPLLAFFVPILVGVIVEKKKEKNKVLT